MMTLIADSGSTKTDWTLLHSSNPQLKTEVIATFRTQGITPIHQTAGDIREILERELLPQLSSFPRAKLIASGVLENPLLQNLHLYFYGSGCTPAHVPMMVQLMVEELSPKTVEVHSDLMAAARALCQHEAGMACILGTGANSCLYDGEQIIQNTPALGYILGDEGSGSVLGRLFLNAIFKNPALSAVRDEFLKANKMELKDIIQKVYREPMVNRWLASLSPFIMEHIGNPLIREIVVYNFREFFRKNIVPYNRPDLQVHFVGSMAHHYHDELEEAAKIDGANDLVIFARVELPLQGALLATFTLFTAVGYWNEWFWSTLLINSGSKMTLQVVLKAIVAESAALEDVSTGEAGMDAFAQGIKMAAVMLTMVPIMCLYPFLQKYFIKGVLVGSVKM